MKSFLSDRKRLIRLSAALFCAIGIVVSSFTLSHPRTESSHLPVICTAKCSTYCGGGFRDCFTVKCCNTDSGGCLVGDESIYSVHCKDKWSGGGGGGGVLE